MKFPFILKATGEAAKIINADMRNPNINRDIMEKCKKLAKDIKVR